MCEHIEQDSPIYARIFARRIMALAGRIPSFPQTGRVVPEYGDADLRERIYSGYRIVYRVRSNPIEVVAICHGSRLLKNVMPDE